MKKLLLFILILTSLAIICAYLFIPADIQFSNITFVKAKANVAGRFLLNENKWEKWFPADIIAISDSGSGHLFHYKNYSFSIEKTMMNTAEISILDNGKILKSLASIISINGDSVAVEWKSEIQAGSNPFARIKYYLQARKLHTDMGNILNALKKFLGKNENIYNGIKFHVVISKDSTLIATKTVTTGYPSTSDIYTMIGDLKEYLVSHYSEENNFPMLHVKQISDSTYETMVAIPTNKKLDGNEKIFSKSFVPWKVLTAEIKGGNYKVDEALKEMKEYLTDYHIPAMAIPFASLVTDRSREPDTLQWITHIYTPIP